MHDSDVSPADNYYKEEVQQPFSLRVPGGSVCQCHGCQINVSESGATCNSLPMTNFILEKYTTSTQGLEASIQERGSSSESGADCSPCTNEAPSADAEIAVSHNSMSNLKVSTRHDLALVFTCKVCETRSMKTCSRDSYEKGVVVVRCGGCDNLHLIADRLGWFGEPGSIDELLAARGDVVKKGPVDSLNLTIEDLAGNKI